MLSLAPPTVIDSLEQSSGVYWGTIYDDEGIFLPSNVLNTLTLTLYVVQADGSIAYVNTRNAQDVLNANNVQVYPALQTRADGFQFNLKWMIQPADTTLVEQVPFERHIALFEWSWPLPVGGQAQGKHEVILNVKNLGEV
jgi:hypothetical protein